VYLHASKWSNAEEMQRDWDDTTTMYRKKGGPSLPPVTLGELRSRGGYIVGRFEIADCVRACASAWFVGPNGWMLRNAVAFAQPIPCRGARQLFPVPGDVLARIRAVDAPGAMIAI
jgi:glutathione S-transferase